MILSEIAMATMPLSAQALRVMLSKEFPPNATSWGQATDEVRDLARYARESVGLGKERAVNFRKCDTPAKWNTQGINAIIKFYEMMNDEQKTEFYKQCASTLNLSESKEKEMECPYCSKKMPSGVDHPAVWKCCGEIGRAVPKKKK